MKRALVALFAALIAGAAFAQAWPTKPIRFIVPYPAGGTSDILARTIGEKLGTALGQTIVVENKPGANGNVGADYVAKAAPDGYTFLLADIGAIAISPSVYLALPFDPVKDFTPVTMVAYSPHILVVHPSIPAASVKELIALAKSKPGVLNYGSVGNGSQPHLAAEMFKQLAGVDFTHVGEKLVAESLALGGAAHEAGDIDEVEPRRFDPGGSGELCQHVETRIGHHHFADVRLDRAERVIRRLHRRGRRQGIEER